MNTLKNNFNLVFDVLQLRMVGFENNCVRVILDIKSGWPSSERRASDLKARDDSQMCRALLSMARTARVRLYLDLADGSKKLKRGKSPDSRLATK